MNVGLKLAAAKKNLMVVGCLAAAQHGVCKEQ